MVAISANIILANFCKMISIYKSIRFKWKLSFNENYKWTSKKELYNTKTMRKIKKTMKSKSYNIYLGIDPDVSKSGVAYYVSETKVLELSNLSFFNLYDYLKFAKENQGDNNLTIVIEAGWLNKSNWHKVAEGSSSINAKIGQHTGANHEVGKKIVEMCEYLLIKYMLVRPTKAKIRHENFKKLTGIIGSTNQEQRDAAMLVWGL